MWFSKKKYVYTVTFEASGRHPYLVSNELDYFQGKKEYIVEILATDFNNAEKVALDTAAPPFKCWSRSVVQVRRGKPASQFNS